MRKKKTNLFGWLPFYLFIFIAFWFRSHLEFLFIFISIVILVLFNTIFFKSMSCTRISMHFRSLNCQACEKTIAIIFLIMKIMQFYCFKVEDEKNLVANYSIISLWKIFSRHSDGKSARSLASIVGGTFLTFSYNVIARFFQLVFV